MNEKKNLEFSIFGCQTCGSQEIRPSHFRLGIDVHPCHCGGVWYVRRAGKREVPPDIRRFWEEKT
jgi:hypothetical protein